MGRKGLFQGKNDVDTLNEMELKIWIHDPIDMNEIVLLKQKHVEQELFSARVR